MATIEGAQAIGLGEKIGSLEVGKEADIILVDLTTPNMSPVLLDPIRNIVPNLVYAGSGHEVKTVIVAGTVVMRDYHVLTVDEGTVDDGFQGRKWDVNVEFTQQARERETAEKDRKAKDDRNDKLERLRDAVRRHPDGETKSSLRTEAKLSANLVNELLPELILRGDIQECKVKKNKRLENGFRPVQSTEQSSVPVVG